jgi:hypothetical protein
MFTHQRKCAPKSYAEIKAEIKAEMETIQQQMAEAKKNEPTDALKKVKQLCKKFSFTARMLKGFLAENRAKQ